MATNVKNKKATNIKNKMANTKVNRTRCSLMLAIIMTNKVDMQDGDQCIQWFSKVCELCPF